MKLLSQAILKKLLKNGLLRQSASKEGEEEHDFKPVVKLFMPSGSACWLLTEVDPEYEDLAFGLCDLGLGFPEIGYVSLEELGQIRTKHGLSIERDRYFKAEYPLSVYARAAGSASMITESQADLDAASHD